MGIEPAQHESQFHRRDKRANDCGDTMREEGENRKGPTKRPAKLFFLPSDCTYPRTIATHCPPCRIGRNRSRQNTPQDSCVQTHPGSL